MEQEQPQQSYTDKDFANYLESINQQKPETEDELWEQVVNSIIDAYEKWMKPESEGKGDFGEAVLRKQFTIKRK